MHVWRRTIDKRFGNIACHMRCLLHARLTIVALAMMDVEAQAHRDESVLLYVVRT